MRRIVLATMALSASVAAAPASNPLDTSRIERGFQQLLSASLDRLFLYGDANRDGYLEAAEFARVNQSHGVPASDPRVFVTMDLDRDGRLSKNEMMRAIRAFHDRMASQAGR